MSQTETPPKGTGDWISTYKLLRTYRLCLKLRDRRKALETHAQVPSMLQWIVCLKLRHRRKALETSGVEASDFVHPVACLKLRHRRKALETHTHPNALGRSTVRSQTETPPKGTGDEPMGQRLTLSSFGLKLRHRRKALETLNSAPALKTPISCLKLRHRRKALETIAIRQPTYGII